jgi:hypothetical protein
MLAAEGTWLHNLAVLEGSQEVEDQCRSRGRYCTLGQPLGWDPRTLLQCKGVVARCMDDEVMQPPSALGCKGYAGR